MARYPNKCVRGQRKRRRKWRKWRKWRRKWRRKEKNGAFVLR
jgi:hypothetical protein